MKLIECVPNISEGKNRAIIDELTAVIRQCPEVTLLDVDPGIETHRTVFTFVGTPSGVVQAAFQFITRATELIDMREHHGAHARIGAVDVCPLIPIEGVTLQECAGWAQELAARVGSELKIPTYLYEAAATSEPRRLLSHIRKGEYEGLKEKLTQAEWQPDYGPAEWSERTARSGACVIGARPFLIAYNVNLNTRDKKLASEIASHLRESGRPQRDDNGAFVLDERGEKVHIPGRLKATQATGWYIPEYGCAQVSMNLKDMTQTTLATALTACEEEAQKLGVRVTGSEIVGLVPKEALLEAGRAFLMKMGKPSFAPESELIEMASRSLGLSDSAPFSPAQKIIEYRLKTAAPLAEMSVEGFMDELSSHSPAPGGGSASALLGALATALTSMVCHLSIVKSPEAAIKSELSQIGAKAQALKGELVRLIDDDTRAFNSLLSAMRLPKSSDPALKQKATLQAQEESVRVPMEVMKAAQGALKLCEYVSEHSHANCISDIGVAIHSAIAAVEGAYLNVRINLAGYTDRFLAGDIQNEADKIRTQSRKISQRALLSVEKILS